MSRPMMFMKSVQVPSPNVELADTPVNLSRRLTAVADNLLYDTAGRELSTCMDRNNS